MIREEHHAEAERLLALADGIQDKASEAMLHPSQVESIYATIDGLIARAQVHAILGATA